MPVAAVLILQIYEKNRRPRILGFGFVKSEKSAGQTRGVRGVVAPKPNAISCSRVAGLSPAESESRGRTNKRRKRRTKRRTTTSCQGCRQSRQNCFLVLWPHMRCGCAVASNIRIRIRIRIDSASDNNCSHNEAVKTVQPDELAGSAGG